MNKFDIPFILSFLFVGITLWGIYWAVNDIMTWGHLPYAPTTATIVLGIFGFIVFRIAGKRLVERFAPKPEQIAPDVPVEKTQNETSKGSTSWFPDTFEKTETKKPTKQKKKTITTPQTRHKIHIPFLKTLKRILAVFLLIMNFAISQGVLMGQPEGRSLFLLFILNAFVCLDYLNKTREKKQIE